MISIEDPLARRWWLKSSSWFVLLFSPDLELLKFLRIVGKHFFKPRLTGFHGHMVFSIFLFFYICLCLREVNWELGLALCFCLHVAFQTNWSKEEELWFFVCAPESQSQKKRATSVSCVILSLSTSWIRHIRRENHSDCYESGELDLYITRSEVTVITFDWLNLFLWCQFGFSSVYAIDLLC